MSRQVSRRAFLEQAAGLSLISAGLHIGGAPCRASQSPNEKLNIAAVGVANKGGHNIDELAGQNFVALCDVDETYLRQWGEKHPAARRYRDYRRMLEKEAGSIDAVVVSTADHTHAPAASVALDLGKHVYCEKPLAHTVAEARALAKLAARKKVATQMGTQIHADDNYRRVVEIIQGGVIGPVHAVYNWCNKGWSDGRFHCGETPTPKTLDWDLWLGPAKSRPYCDNIHPANWRRFWEFGSGTFGDMACHVMDLPFWALDLRHPSSVAATGPAIRLCGGTSTLSQAGPKSRSRARAPRTSSPVISAVGRWAPSSAFFAPIGAWLACDQPCCTTRMPARPVSRRASDASAEAGTTAMARGAAWRALMSKSRSSAGLAATASSSRHQQSARRPASSQALSSSSRSRHPIPHHSLRFGAR